MKPDVCGSPVLEHLSLAIKIADSTTRKLVNTRNIPFVLREFHFFLNHSNIMKIPNGQRFQDVSRVIVKYDPNFLPRRVSVVRINVLGVNLTEF